MSVVLSPRAPAFLRLAGARVPPAAADAWLWLAVSAAVLSLVPIGFVSGDGIAQSAAYARGTWSWNPNHLLLEPLGAWWQGTLTALGSARTGPDQLKLLSVLAGAAAVGAFRTWVAAPLAAGRAAANHGTAWVALGSAFSRLWISDEAHMLQLPALVLLAAAAIAYLRRPGARAARAAGAWAGAAALFYVSNLLLGVALALVLAGWHLARQEPRRALSGACAVAAGMAGVAAPVLALAWLLHAPEGVGPLAWMTSYAGGEVSDRAASGYGATLSPGGLAVSGARALYGAASALVDVSPAAAWWRDGRAGSPAALLPLAAFAAAAVVMAAGLRHAVRARQQPAGRAALVLAGAWTAAVLGFGAWWNNSDDQFYFQLAVVFGALAALVPLRLRGGGLALPVLAALALAWNAAGMARLVLYPRDARVATLRDAVTGAGLVVYPGMDEVNQLLFFLGDSVPAREVLAVTTLATRYRPAEGLARLDSAVSSALAAGMRVDVVEVVDAPPLRHPWKSVRGMGYPHAEVVRVLARRGIGPERRAGPFSLRSIHPPAAPSPVPRSPAP